ncbi:MAG: undecaprenyl-diphosphate phosphatase [Candidatus Omnitrophica bacterium]|nr:undecaprenyl-diphosphate phosphatase [Candidatus Omnitrophota bacterium]
MSHLIALILGMVEGITEFLPISSTGHLILTSKLLHLADSEFLKSFEIIIQLGAILSVVVLYWKSFFTNLATVKRIAVAFLPTAVIGFIFYKLIKKFLLSNSDIVIWSLLLGGIFLIIFEMLHKENTDSSQGILAISYKQAFFIGIFQSFAMIPGVSRSAATIIGGMFLGISRKTIVEFSFLLAVPTMGAAVGLDLIKNSPSFAAEQFGFLATGFIVSFIVALAAIKFLLSYIQKNNFIPFGFYRIIVAIIFITFFRF